MAWQLQKSPILSMFYLLLIIVLINGSEAAGILSVYWGQNTSEGSLAAACEPTSNYSIVNIAFLSKFGNNTAVLNLTGHCNATADGYCTGLSHDIEVCQKQGIKVLLSIGGHDGSGSYNLTSAADTSSFATYLWDHYLGGQSYCRPFGDAVLDGIDFAIEKESKYWDELARNLSSFYTQQKKKTYLLTAAPQCPFPDKYLKDAIDTRLFDYISVQFYNHDQCEYKNMNFDQVKGSFKEWAAHTNDFKSLLLLGFPAAKEAANSGYVNAHNLIEEMLKEYDHDNRKYGGVTLWNRYYDKLSGYSAAIKRYV